MRVPFNYLPMQFSDTRSVFKEWRKLIKSSEFTLGPFVKKFEENFSNFIGAKYCISTNSGTDALILSLKALGVKKIKIGGNLKYFGKSKKILDKNIKKLFRNRLIFCAASTHYNEELFIGKIHKELRLRYNNLLTIIIPRHANRSESITNELENINLRVITRSSKKKISKNTDIFMVDTYGETSKFYGLSNITFLGGSLIPHGGQNPLEPARMGSYILHGPYTQNFKEIYILLSKLNVSSKINNIISMKKIAIKKIKYKQPRNVSQKLFFMGDEILKKNLNEIKMYF